MPDYTYIVKGKPFSSKNSRVTDRSTGRTFTNATAARWMKAAKIELTRQHKKQGQKDLLTGCYSLTVTVYRNNRQGLNDNDSPLTVLMDCLKGVVVVDDKPQHIGWVSGGTILDRKLEEEYVKIELTAMDCLTSDGK